MADGLELNAGTGGATAATDDCGVAGHAQIVKLAISTDGSATLITADTNGLEVQGAGAAGTAAGGVVTVQGVASMTPVQVADNGGSLTVDGTVSVAGVATETKQDTQITALQLIDDIVRSEDEASADTHKGAVVLAVRQDTPEASSGTDGDYEPLKVVGGRLATQATISGAIPAGTNAIGKLAANSGVDIGDVDILSIAAGDNNIGNVDVVSSALPTGASTAAKQPALGTAGTASADVISVQGIASMTPLLVTAQASTGTQEVVGDVAHDAAAAGNPVAICGVAQNTDDTAPPNRVSAEGDATRLAMDWDGAIFARPHGAQVWSYHDDDTAAVTTDGTVHAAPAAGLSLYMTDLVFSIGAATASSIFLEEGSTKVLGPYYLEAIVGRGLHIQFQTPKKITAATALLVTNTGSISFSVDITGYTAPG